MPFKQIKRKMHGAAADSIVLTFVKVVTALLGILSTKLLSTQFSLQDYGTYSQAMLIVSTVTSITILGLTDATNYFYNAADDDETKQKNIATVFGIQYFVGVLSGMLICALCVPITRYFNNEDLLRVIFLAAWIPVFDNLIPMLQVLFVSIGKAKLIAIRNFIVSAARLLFVAIAAFLTKDIGTIIALILALDVLQTVYFFYSFSKCKFRIKLSDFRKELVKPVLTFSIPMAVFVFTSALSRDIDKYVISYFTDTQTLALYTNAAKVLPFDLFTASFLTVLVPIVTRQVRNRDYSAAQTTLKAYLRIGYLTTWILVAGAIINAKEMMLFFYDEKYLPALGVFIVYLLVDFTRFANTSLILSAKGKTRVLMKWSVLSLAANLVLNVIAYMAFGVIGPALTTLLITIILIIIYLTISAKEIDTCFVQLFDWREMSLETVEIVVLGGAAYAIKRLLYTWSLSYIVILILVYGFFVGAMFLLNKKRLQDCLRTINRLK